jgi:outer membrane protein OmpA-like peptidoglycan-associated protein
LEEREHTFWAGFAAVRLAVVRVAVPLNAEALELARRVASALAVALEWDEPAAVEIATALARESFRDPGLAVEDRPPRRDVALAALARDLRAELLAGRIRVTPLETNPLTERPELLGEVPVPLPPAPSDERTLSFEVRLVDEIGKAISGIPVELATNDGETHDLTTNAAGIALLDSTQASGATAAVNELDGLQSTLADRWSELRDGKPPKESNQTELAFDSAPIGPVELKPALMNTIVLTPPLGKLFVELWDKTGRTRHANRTFQISGPRAFEGTTDENGRLLQTEVFPGDYSLSLDLEFFEESDPDFTQDTVESPLVVLDASAGEPEERMLGAVPFSLLVRIRSSFNTNKAFLLPTALPSMLELREIYTNNAPAKLLVVGHADTQGDAAYNDKLSLERSKATIAYLEDDVDGWYAFYGDGIEQAKRWGKVEDNLMIHAMPGFVDKPLGENLVHWYQRTRGLEVDSIAGSDTRHRLIAEYMALDGTSLSDFVGEIDAVAHGCGENFPLDDAGAELDDDPPDDKNDPIDRRVELFFFDTEFGVTPAPPGENSQPGSVEYPLWLDRVSTIIDLDADDAERPSLSFVEVTDAHFRTDSAVVLPEAEDPSASGQHAAFTSAGLVATVLRVNEEQGGRPLLVAGHTDTAGSEAHNDELSLERAKVMLALLAGNRDDFSSLCNARNQPADVNQILSFIAKAFDDLPFACDPGKIADSVDPACVRRFQSDFNRNKPALGSSAADLDVDGRVGELTWGAFFDCYELALQRLLGEDAAGVAELRDQLQFADPDRKALGFGERFPIEELGVDNFRSQTNRRVEVLFFNPGEEPDLEHAQNDPDTSDIYLPSVFKRVPIPVRSTTRVKVINLVAGSFQKFRMTGATFEVNTDTGATVVGRTDANGAVLAKVPADTREFSLKVEDSNPLPEFQERYEGRYKLRALAAPDTPHGAIQRLRMLGLWTGPELAVFSEGTLEALSYFQLLAGLSRTGTLDDATASALDDVTKDPGAAA